ncbi:MULTISPECIES: HAD-IC family P-type ATPase [unclassified Enterococcus]|uniref:HAD-IC family P-type ATPase n=1 Tax=unclassified Enterococcus TaxID=2608891 RepID=UPI001903836E|nr:MULTISPECIES: HAD-IC family P-type ATPase [unclassified Enterococcus]MBK0037214.1 HAD-IC family P-type ATPase [Enterococcus sp. S52]MBK0069877.1 HAD-IC family P-type ATPase [Enterococcus sp. S53]MBK0140470.1 HAD-IC family P-type ATPase [Enterococcus sp. S76]MBK0143857.1 HAD-IC family P-type ATPase [Enterococcus sp. S77]
MTQLPTGLTAAEVAKKTQEGLHNDYETKTSKSTAAIIKDNLLTLFNFLNLLIGVFLFAVGAYSNMFYLAIIFVNITIGISQELHARNLVKKLSLVSPQTVRVIRDAQIHEISAKELVLEDVVILGAGDQIPADMTVLSGLVEVNEAMLTGEADLVVKEAGASLLSGSFIVSGEMTGTVLHVGAENYAAKLSNEAKVHKPIRSELLASIRSVSKFTSYVIVPLGVILFFQAFMMRDAGIKESVVVSAAALLGMLPKGLVLLISIALTTGVIKLAKKRILVQDMYAVETLAHVDTLCLDKTGTLTEGHMVLESIVPLQVDSDPNMLLGNYLAASTDNNLTMQALRQGCPELTDHQPIEVAAFSSQRKWGAVAFEHLGNVYLGAPEKVAGSAALPQVIEAQEAGLRVLILAVETDPKTPTSFDPTNAQAVAVLILSDIIRQNAEETLAYLADQGIDLKVISGDNPIAVAAIAHRAGLANADQAIDLSTLTTEAEVREAATRYTVFGRVTPEQKKLLVQELKANQRTVAMTGDGVNDVLALREADVSIAMAAGDSAARQIANFVLLDSDFTTLPDVLFEGRRVVNNVTKASGIFFIKTIYSFLLSLVCILTSSAFPFLPIQITLIDLAIEGYPSFFLSFEENKAPIKGRYLPTVLLNALPNALLVLVNYFAIRFLQTDYGWSQFDTTTLLYYLLIGISCIAVIRACLPLNPLRLFLAITTTVGIYVAAMLFHGLLEVGFLTAVTLPYFLGMMALNICLYVGLSFLTKRFSAKVLVKQS